MTAGTVSRAPRPDPERAAAAEQAEAEFGGAWKIRAFTGIFYAAYQRAAPGVLVAPVTGTSLGDVIAHVRAIECAAISAVYPGWHAWVSDTGRYWATRRGGEDLTRHHDYRWARTIGGTATPAGLRDLITEQEQLPAPGEAPPPAGV